RRRYRLYPAVERPDPARRQLHVRRSRRRWRRPGIGALPVVHRRTVPHGRNAMKPLILSLALALPLLAGAPVHAQAQAQASAQTPGRQVVETGTRVLTTLQQRRPEFQKDRKALRAYIESELRTGFDREYAARLVLGPHGRGASEADVALFADAMTDNLMQRYGDALLAFEGRPRIRLKSETPLPNNRGVRVSTEILRDGGDPIPVDYLVRNNGGWKI